MSSTSFADWGDLSPKGPFPITLEAAPDLFRQCSRSAPTPDGAIWLPSRVEIEKLETALPKYLASHKTDYFKKRGISKQYRGQHVGFMLDGARYIYASYFPDDRSFLHKNGEAVIMCDGGPNFWGIVYNPVTGEFTELHVNGR